MTSDDPRQTALKHLGELHACLRQSPNVDTLTGLAEQTEQLAKSVETFHMEAIRFRLYGLRRQLTTHTGPLPDGTKDLLDQVSQALEAAGFQVK